MRYQIDINGKIAALSFSDEMSKEELFVVRDFLLNTINMQIDKIKEQITTNTPIEDVGFSVRTYNTLKRSNINKVGELLALNDDEIKAIRYMGRNSINEVKEKLATLKEGDQNNG